MDESNAHGESLVHLVLSEQSFHDLLNRERRISLDIYQEGIPL